MKPLTCDFITDYTLLTLRDNLPQNSGDKPQLSSTTTNLRLQRRCSYEQTPRIQHPATRWTPWMAPQNKTTGTVLPYSKQQKRRWMDRQKKQRVMYSVTIITHPLTLTHKTHTHIFLFVISNICYPLNLLCRMSKHLPRLSLVYREIISNQYPKSPYFGKGSL